MSFDSLERSIASGKPIRLYLFERGLKRWAYCTADRDITYQGQVYTTTAISDDGIRQSGQASADALVITGPADLQVAQLYRGVPPSREITLTIRDIHIEEIVSDAVVSWVGSIYDVNWPAADRCKITCQSLAASFQQPGLRMTWERGCPHTLYDRGCRVDRELFKAVATVESLDGAMITNSIFAGYPDGVFDAGFVEWSIGDGEFETRTIETHTGSNLVLLGGTDGLQQGQSINAYPGCDLLYSTCKIKFNNTDNFGGVPGLPGRSPFDGNPIF